MSGFINLKNFNDMKKFYVTYVYEAGHPRIRSITIEGVCASGLSEGRIAQTLTTMLRKHLCTEDAFILNYWEI